MGSLLERFRRFICYGRMERRAPRPVCSSPKPIRGRQTRCSYLKVAGLSPGGVHIFRHSAAKLRRDAGESVEEVSRFLDHSSLAVTTTYLRRLEGQEDKSWEKVAAARGV